ncbi:SRPBCC family protein [Streptomyces sp. NPDC004647]|uniref:SRPBCC family protein n=1 Tax=Streptomyces sp. NPDC004647 TaxID=3154671 RepID=UPI0033B06ACD
MGDTRVVVERRIAAPVGQVWEALTDLESAPQVLSGVERVEVLTSGPFAVGTRWRETRRMFGREATEEMYVTAAEQPEHIVVEADSRGAHYVSEFTLSPEPEDTTAVRMAFSATEPGGFAGLLTKLFGKLGARAVVKAMEKDLADIAAAVERPAAS